MENKLRECNGCTLCCLICEVPPLSKPSGTQCINISDIGCGIHNTRPDICRNYWCAYHTEKLSEDLHPNNCHIMFDLLPESNVFYGVVDPKYNNSWVTDSINKFAEKQNSKGISVIITTMSNEKFIKTPEDVKHIDVLENLTKAYIRVMEQ